MRIPHAAIIAAVEQAIPFDGDITTRDLRAGLALRLCTRTVCRALQVLVTERRATFTGDMGQRRYRRLPQRIGEAA